MISFQPYFDRIVRVKNGSILWSNMSVPKGPANMNFKTFVHHDSTIHLCFHSKCNQIDKTFVQDIISLPYITCPQVSQSQSVWMWRAILDRKTKIIQNYKIDTTDIATERITNSETMWINLCLAIIIYDGSLHYYADMEPDE